MHFCLCVYASINPSNILSHLQNNRQEKPKMIKAHFPAKRKAYLTDASVTSCYKD